MNARVRRRGGRIPSRLLLAALVALLAVGPGLGHSTRSGGHPTLPASEAPVLPFDARPLSNATGDWTTWHGDEARSGYSPVNGPGSAAQLWAACGAGSAANPIRVAPVTNATRVFFADLGGVVYAVDRATGASVWNRSLGGILTTADLTPPFLVLGDAGGGVTALDAATGLTLWRVPLAAGIVQGIAEANGTVYVGTAAGAVVALALATGATEWSVTLGNPIGGALALGGGFVYAVTSSGDVAALSTAGLLRWQAPLDSAVDSGPALGDGVLVVGAEDGIVTALSPANGSVRWSWDAARLASGDEIESTPAIAPSAVYVATDLGNVYALAPANGSVLWHARTTYAGYPMLAAPAASPDGVYLPTSDGFLTDFDAATGRIVWQAALGTQRPSFSSPALEGGDVYAGNEFGCLYAFGPRVLHPTYLVAGTVVNASGGPVANAVVDAGDVNYSVTSATGAFSFGLMNGSYNVSVLAGGYAPLAFGLTVSGPVAPLSITLSPAPLYPVTGRVFDEASGDPIAGLALALAGPYGYAETTVTATNGSFALRAPNGTAVLSTPPVAGYGPVSVSVAVAGASVGGVAIAVPPTAGAVASADPDRLVVWLPLGAVTLVASAWGIRELRRARRAVGLTSPLLSPFARTVAMRALLIPGQAVAVLTILYVFGTFLPAASQNLNPCTLATGACASCSWANFLCVARAFGSGYATFLGNLFTGQWGNAQFGLLSQPALSFLEWWLPASVELALVSLALAALLAYPLGLVAGWRPESAFDTGTRVVSLLGLLVPSFLLVLLVVTPLYAPFSAFVGDVPFGTLPSALWFDQHGGLPVWIGVRGENTLPTGFPLVDGALHGAWSFEGIVLAKTLLQASIIAVIYVAIFLRYARHAVAQASGETHVVAAKARGVPDRTILWRHTGRRVLPLYLLVFGITLPVYIGTQAVVEALFNDNGLGTLLLIEMTRVSTYGFGYSQTGELLHPGNFYQVSIFLLLLLVLVGSLLADLLAGYLDPRAVRRGS